jgi:hypothetical protein
LEWVAPASGSTFSGCSLYKSASQSIADSTHTALTFDLEFFDTDSYHSTVTNTSRITIPSGKTGYYSFSGNATFASNSTGVRIGSFYKNGSPFRFLYNANASTGSDSIINFTTIAYLTATDYMELRVFQSSTAALNVQAGTDITSFNVTFLGA